MIPITGLDGGQPVRQLGDPLGPGAVAGVVAGVTAVRLVPRVGGGMAIVVTYLIVICLVVVVEPMWPDDVRCRHD
jgi:hypothetical protein